MDVKSKFNNRDSNYELLRLVAIFFIVYYHLLRFFVAPESSMIIYQSLQIPLHIGVPVFVLISGYYGIKLSMCGLLRILLPLLFFYVPIETAGHFWIGFDCADSLGLANPLFFISQSPYWFVRTYFWLFLLSPVLNLYLKESTSKQRLYLLAVLCIIAVYFGTVRGDSSLFGGKNVVNFMFIYVLGNTIRHYQKIIDGINLSSIIIGYILLNALILFLYHYFYSPTAVDLLTRLCFSYCSPLLIHNAVLFFLIFGRLHFHNEFVNRVASSTFSVYIIHHVPFILFWILRPITMSVVEIGSPSYTIGVLSVLSLGVMSACIITDQIFRPLFDYITKKVDSYLIGQKLG